MVRPMGRVIFIIIFLSLPSCARNEGPLTTFGQKEFETLLNEVSEGWNNNDAARAAAAFSPNAIYSEPPDKQLFIGRKALFEFFGGDNGRDVNMNMTWHHIVYNPETLIGAAEWTFIYQGEAAHGMVSIKVEDGLITNWREYFYESPLEWDAFQGSNKF
ncbi:MAG: nuclear transport factor 2 family protein [Marinicaulis sp.]|nr:nuclear transport factor 2 family protein [Marinicaulis sp.]